MLAGRPEPDPADEAPLRLADARSSTSTASRARHARRGRRRAAHRRSRPPQDLRALRAPARPLPRARRRRAADLRSDRAQPRHGRRLARARRPAGRLGLGPARRAAPRSVAQGPDGERTIAIDDFFLGPVHDGARARRDPHRGARPRSGRRARAAPTSSSSARSATSPPRRSRVHVSLANGTRRARSGSRSPASARRTSAPARPRRRSRGAEPTDEAIEEAARLAAEAAEPQRRQPRHRRVQAQRRAGVHRARPADSIAAAQAGEEDR